MPNKIDLTSREAIGRIDEQNMLGSIESLGQQITHAWESARKLTYTPSAQIRNVVFAGMGGSALGAAVIETVFKSILKVPFQIVRDYTLPGYTDQHSLVILSSYSGTTEEILSCAAEAKLRGAQRMVIAAGGDLISLAQTEQLTHFHIDPIHNPSNQPRAALGYAIFGSMGLLQAAGILTIMDDDISSAVAAVDSVAQRARVEVATEDNPAKILAFQMYDKRPLFVVADFLEGAAHVATNVANENAKTFADYKVLPEINHHLMEGLRYPASNTTSHVFVFFMSLLYHERSRLRVELTQQIVEEEGFEAVQIPLTAPTKIAQSFELIALVAYAIFYLTMLEGINPSPIPVVDRFKSQLGK